jgi:hypothetical protein
MTTIMDELKRLQDIESFLTQLWQDEVHQYEQTSLLSTVLPGAGAGAGGSGSGSGGADEAYNCVSRNHANSTGTVDNESLFPYHTSLYPLLDCYDSIIVEGGGIDYNNKNNKNKVQPHSSSSSVVRPSPAPMPSELDGHRRSINSPRIDRNEIHIEELETITEHLPNSAWAIQQSLMPHHRKLQFIRDCEKNADDHHPQISTNVLHNENQDFERFRKDDYRFWNILMNPELEAYPILSEDMSVWSDDSDGWEDYEDEDDANSNVEILEQATRLQNAKFARDFRFLRWWRRTLVQERRGMIHESNDPGEILRASDNSRYSPESLFADNTSSFATLVLLKVLKHSLSDLQRELRLAQAVVLLIADWELCIDSRGRGNEGKDDAPNQGIDEIDGIECLRRLLLIISSEYFSSCGGYCHERYIANATISEEDAPNHYCCDVSHDNDFCVAFIFEISHILNAPM